MLFESIGPVWDGNEVWLVIAGGATFAAFPAWYATMFSGFYLALLLILFFLIIRVVSFEWRRRATVRAGGRSGSGELGRQLRRLAHLGHRARKSRLRRPAQRDGDFTGTFWDLFSAYTVFAGVAVVLFFAFHGAVYLTLRTTGDLCERALQTARRLALPAAALAGAFQIWTVFVAVDRNDKNVFPPVLPAVLGIVAALLAVFFVIRGARVWPLR